MATAYHRDQPGAPALVYGASDNTVAHFTALKTVLKACLISGYGSLPAAGWELITEGTNYIVLRPGSHVGYLGLTWVNGGAIRVYLSETYTGMSGDVMTGDGLKTGLEANNSVAHALSAATLVTSSAACSWSLVADARTFALCMAGQSSNAEVVSIARGAITLYAGEDSAGNLIALGGGATNQTGGYSVAPYFSSLFGMTVLKNPATGLLVGVGALAAVTPSLGNFTGAKPFNAVVKLSSAQLAKAAWIGSGLEAGFLRGVAVTPELAYVETPSHAAQSLGRATPLQFRDIGSPIALGDGHNYFPRMARNTSNFFLLTDNPVFW
jgi:hypothetical protein